MLAFEPLAVTFQRVLATPGYRRPVQQRPHAEDAESLNSGAGEIRNTFVPLQRRVSPNGITIPLSTRDGEGDRHFATELTQIEPMLSPSVACGHRD